MKNDFEPELRGLLKRLVDDGFELVSGNNGLERFGIGPASNFDSFVADLLATDEARIFLLDGGKSGWVLLIYGNSPGELPSDYSISDKLDNSVRDHYDEWCGRPQPTKDT